MTIKKFVKCLLRNMRGLKLSLMQSSMQIQYRFYRINELQVLSFRYIINSVEILQQKTYGVFDETHKGFNL